MDGVPQEDLTSVALALADVAQRAVDYDDGPGVLSLEPGYGGVVAGRTPDPGPGLPGARGRRQFNIAPGAFCMGSVFSIF